MVSGSHPSAERKLPMLQNTWTRYARVRSSHAQSDRPVSIQRIPLGPAQGGLTGSLPWWITTHRYACIRRAWRSTCLPKCESARGTRALAGPFDGNRGGRSCIPLQVRSLPLASSAWMHPAGLCLGRGTAETASALMPRRESPTWPHPRKHLSAPHRRPRSAPLQLRSGC
jgi:hypothetical protein